MMNRLLRLNEAARLLGVNVQTLRNWDNSKKINVVRTIGNQRRIPEQEVHRLMGEMEIREVKLYARVSSHAQRDDFTRQIQRLKQLYPKAELFSDIRSGLKFDRKEFLRLLNAIQQRRVSKVVVVYEDRLARFGIDLLRRIFSSYGTELEVLDTTPHGTPEEELSKDLVSIITSFSARLYGLRSHKTQKLLRETRKVLND